MAKRDSKKIIDFLEAKIAKTEERLVRNNGEAALDFDKLFRYLKLRDYYADKEVKI